jgi:hypothetical protein
MSTIDPGPGTPGATTVPVNRESAGRYGAPTGHGPQGGGPGFTDRVSEFTRELKTPETKEFYKTSEFLVWGLTVLGILVAAALVGGENDQFLSDEAWKYVAWVSIAYIVSRGIAKAATHRGYGDAPLDRDGHGHGRY